MASLELLLIDRDAGLLRLLDPPLARQQPSAGYIQAYPPGVRENGGQYSHAGVWALMAQAALGDGDAAYRSFTYLSPAHRSRHPVHGAAYAIEPYVIAGDVYSAPPYVGRGGWSWYTGSAAWLQRAAIESMFGLSQHGDEIAVAPTLPTGWESAELRLARAGKTMRIMFTRSGAAGSLVPAGAGRLAAGQRLSWSALESASTWLVELPAADAGGGDAHPAALAKVG
jgi:cyclic beta-1,2-glucan synthetase